MVQVGSQESSSGVVGGGAEYVSAGGELGGSCVGSGRPGRGPRRQDRV